MMRPSASSWMRETILPNFAELSSTKPSGLGRRVAAVGEAIVEDLAHRRARLHLLGRQAVHLGVALVADDNALLGVEHGQALRHVVHGGVELLVAALELLLALSQQDSFCSRQPRIELLALGDVLVRADEAAVRHRPAQRPR